MRKRTIFLALILAGALFLSACSGRTASDEETSEMAASEMVTSDLVSSDKVVEEILQSDHITIDDAYELLNSSDLSDESAQELLDQITLLKNCAGRFVQTSETTNNRYTADVSFYYSGGDLYFSMEYTGYMGEITDAVVCESTQEDFRFESTTIGNLYGREQDFRILFGTQSLYISWADTCEYTLTRGDGSAESVQEHQTTLEESGLLETMTSKIDEIYDSFEHRIVYDEDTSTVSIYIQGTQGLRTALTRGDSDLLESWQTIAEGAETISKTFYTSLSINDYAKDVYFYWVDELSENNEYSQDQILLLADNGTILYNIADSSQTQAQTQAQTQEQSSANAGTSGNSTHTLTAGERNALETAKNYLSLMAFSYSSLVSQLEYEGYTTAEAEYAADHCGADWNQQAVKKANEYLNYMSFSKSGLIDQLEYEGFTHSQAVYGVEQAY